MVAVIKTGHSLNRIINYNENKVKEGMAILVSASGYPMEAEQLSFKNKLNRLQKQAALNENVQRNSVHISLNFDPSEKLSKENLQAIADTYMQKIGFGEQPYLVYQHLDAGHPHLHIVSVKVRANGSRIDTQNIGRNQSEKARKEIEQTFGLVRAAGRKKEQVFTLNPLHAQKVQYGHSETKRAITNVLDTILNNYKYASLPELNAVLQKYHVLADRGGEQSRVFKHRGLVYRVLDEQGNKVGVPIKASDIYNKPTLAFLESKFEQNAADRQQYKAWVWNAIDLAFGKHRGLSLTELTSVLAKQGIYTLLRQNTDGVIYGITYVDHRTKCVFNGSDLGKQYSAKGILERCNQQVNQPYLATDSNHRKSHTKEGLEQSVGLNTSVNNTIEGSLLETLMQPQHSSGYVPNALTNKGRKKKKKRISKHL